jgi:hypothetical protein
MSKQVFESNISFINLYSQSPKHLYILPYTQSVRTKKRTG